MGPKKKDKKKAEETKVEESGNKLHIFFYPFIFNQLLI